MAGVNQKSLYLSFVTAVLSFFISHSGLAQGTAFFYQGQLNNNGAAANGSYNFQFQVFNAVTNGSAVSGSLTNFNVAVNNGLFTVTLDFGPGIFTGNNVWLGIGVCTNNTTTFTPLWPRQPVLPIPYAIFATSASNLVGTLPSSAFSGGYTNSVALTNGANLFTGSFSGNGGSVTNVNVTNLTGVLADSQLPINTAFLNSNQTFMASNTFNGVNIFTNLYGNSFSGSFFGNGLVGWVVVPGTSVQASIDHGYLLTNSQVVTVTLPTTINPGDIVRIACASPSGWQLGQNAGQSVIGSFLNFGKLWFKTGASPMNWSCLASSANGDRMAATVFTGGNTVYLSNNGGQTWMGSSSPSKLWDAVAISSDGSKLVAAVTNGGGIYTSSDSGSTWTLNSPSTLNCCSVASSADGSKLVAVAFGTAIYTNNGTTWAVSVSGGDWTSVASSSSGANLVAVGNNGTGIYTSANAGSTWSGPAGSTTGMNWISVASSSSGTRLIAAAFGSGVYISTDAGVSWPRVTSLPASVNWSSVASSSDGSKLIATVNGGVVYTSSNWGASWQTNTTTADWATSAESSDGTTLAAGINDTASLDVNGIYLSEGSEQSSTTVGTSGYIFGGPGSAAELIYIGNNQFMPASFSGQIWAY